MAKWKARARPPSFLSSTVLSQVSNPFITGGTLSGVRPVSRFTRAITFRDRDSLAGTGEAEGTGSSVPVPSTMGDSRGDFVPALPHVELGIKLCKQKLQMLKGQRSPRHPGCQKNRHRSIACCMMLVNLWIVGRVEFLQSRLQGIRTLRAWERKFASEREHSLRRRLDARAYGAPSFRCSVVANRGLHQLGDLDLQVVNAGCRCSVAAPCIFL